MKEGRGKRVWERTGRKRNKKKKKLISRKEGETEYTDERGERKKNKKEWRERGGARRGEETRGEEAVGTISHLKKKKKKVLEFGSETQR